MTFLSMNGIISAKLSASLLIEQSSIRCKQICKLALLCLFSSVNIFSEFNLNMTRQI